MAIQRKINIQNKKFRDFNSYNERMSIYHKVYADFTSKDTATMDICGSMPPLATEGPATPLPRVANNGPTPTQQGMMAGSGQ